jgi:hypothetical protein
MQVTTDDPSTLKESIPFPGPGSVVGEFQTLAYPSCCRAQQIERRLEPLGYRESSASKNRASLLLAFHCDLNNAHLFFADPGTAFSYCGSVAIVSTLQVRAML